MQRQTAKELLRHPFIKRARRNRDLCELIEQCRVWKDRARSLGADSSDHENVSDSGDEDNSWSFGDTMRPQHDTVRNTYEAYDNEDEDNIVETMTPSVAAKFQKGQQRPASLDHPADEDEMQPSSSRQPTTLLVNGTATERQKMPPPPPPREPTTPEPIYHAEPSPVDHEYEEPATVRRHVLDLVADYQKEPNGAESSVPVPVIPSVENNNIVKPSLLDNVLLRAVDTATMQRQRIQKSSRLPHAADNLRGKALCSQENTATDHL